MYHCTYSYDEDERYIKGWNCKLVLSESAYIADLIVADIAFESYHKHTNTLLTKYSIYLGFSNPKSVKSESVIYTNWNSKIPGEPRVAKSKSFSIDVSDRDMGERLLKAFKRLVEISVEKRNNEDKF